MRHGIPGYDPAAQDSDCGPPTLSEPRGDQLERRRIDPRQEESRCETEQDPNGCAVCDPQECIRGGGPNRSSQDHVLRGDNVGKVQSGRDQRPAHEPNLNSDGQPRGGRVGDIPLHPKLGNDR